MMQLNRQSKGAPNNSQTLSKYTPRPKDALKIYSLLQFRIQAGEGDRLQKYKIELLANY